MSKDEAVSKLIGKGFDAVYSEGVVVVRYKSGMYAEVRTLVKNALTDIGYNESWGVSCLSSTDAKYLHSADSPSVPAVQEIGEDTEDAEEDSIIIDSASGQLVFA